MFLTASYEMQGCCWKSNKEQGDLETAFFFENIWRKTEMVFLARNTF